MLPMSEWYWAGDLEGAMCAWTVTAEHAADWLKSDSTRSLEMDPSPVRTFEEMSAYVDGPRRMDKRFALPFALIDKASAGHRVYPLCNIDRVHHRLRLAGRAGAAMAAQRHQYGSKYLLLRML